MSEPSVHDLVDPDLTGIHPVSQDGSYPAVAFDVDKLDGLCHECHEKRHGKMGTYAKPAPKSRRGVWFDESGMPHMEEDA